jgi:hypothetical protein
MAVPAHKNIIIENLNNANKYLDNTKLIIAEFINHSESCDTITNDIIDLKKKYYRALTILRETNSDLQKVTSEYEALKKRLGNVRPGVSVSARPAASVTPDSTVDLNHQTVFKDYRGNRNQMDKIQQKTHTSLADKQIYNQIDVDNSIGGRKTRRRLKKMRKLRKSRRR